MPLAGEGLLGVDSAKAQQFLEGMGDAAEMKAAALFEKLKEQLEDPDQENPMLSEFREAQNFFMMALRLDPDNEEAKEGCEEIKEILKNVETRRRLAAEPNHPEPYDVVIVGAGASGIGVGLMLTSVFGLDTERVLIVERGEQVGETFRRWPKEMRFISPSFNAQGWTKSFDLNSVAHGTSPAFTLHAEHPTGEQYATYLASIAKENKLNVRTQTEVTAVKPFADEKGFEVAVAAAGCDAVAPLRCRYVVWAAGEFQYPKTGGLFPGAEHCMHNSSVRSWAELPGDEYVVIGGYESGMDAAFNLSNNRKRCAVVSSTAHWNVTNPDPSVELAPYTAARVVAAARSECPPRLLAPFRVTAVEKSSTGWSVLAKRIEKEAPLTHEHRVKLHVDPATAGEAAESEITLTTPHPPLLCVGFEGSQTTGIVKDLFAWPKKEEENEGDEGGKEKADAAVVAEGCPKLSGVDESTKTPGLYLCGPMVQHDGLSFCFVYKFRQRFGVVAESIAKGLGFDTTAAVDDAKEKDMYLDESNFSCCEAACGEDC